MHPTVLGRARIRPPFARQLFGVSAAIAVALAFAAGESAASYYEVGLPSGTHRGQPPKGWVIVVHGGGWSGVGLTRVVTIRPETVRFTRRGWGTINVDYRPGASSVTDVIASYDLARARAGRGARICLYGQSAGAHLALVTSLVRDVDCVIVEGAPTDLRGLATQAAFRPSLGGARISYDKAVEAFGAPALGAYSPLQRAAELTAPTLMATAANDWMIPQAQMDALRDARPDRVKALHLAAGTKATGSRFAHAFILRSARSRWEHAKNKLLAAVLL